MDRIVYLSYGKLEFKYECIISIFSLLHQYRSQIFPYGLVIFTDEISIFQQHLPANYPIEFIILDQNQLTNYAGETGFRHRIKINILIESARKYENGILFLDTDTIFINKPNHIFEGIQSGKTFMHLCEGNLKSSNPLFGQINDVLRNTSPILDEFGLSNVHLKMWNSGVVGINKNNIKALDDALSLTDKLFPLCPNHLIEQFALGACFSLNSEILHSYKIVIHYWNYKPFSLFIQEFFKRDSSYIYFEDLLISSHYKKLINIYRPSFFKKLYYFLKQKFARK